MKQLAALALVLLVGCGGRTFDGSAADAGAQLEEVRPSDAGEERTGEGPAGEQPRAAQDGSTALTVEPESLSQPLADALATLEPATQDASTDTPQAPTDAATDAGRRDLAPELEEPEPAPERSPLEEHLAQLEEQGLAVESCRGLVQSVEACCGELAGVAFSCDARGCSCEGTFTNYPAAQSLCSTSPAVPFRWECSP